MAFQQDMFVAVQKAFETIPNHNHELQLRIMIMSIGNHNSYGVFSVH